MLVLVFYLSFFVHTIQSELLFNISTAFTNIKSVIYCGSSIDIYPIFNPKQVLICPYVSIDQENIQLIYMNTCKIR